METPFPGYGVWQLYPHDDFYQLWVKKADVDVGYWTLSGTAGYAEWLESTGGWVTAKPIQSPSNFKGQLNN
ncbi:MAG: hypothetical protein AOA65_0244 [Candidatus Bathyarchaeota archaeon BA1]|nr:MAG: hypothetical protein AOA65_0244 [Candidatus Bathyarchaeota archaeon BA1]